MVHFLSISFSYTVVKGRNTIVCIMNSKYYFKLQKDDKASV